MPNLICQNPACYDRGRLRYSVWREMPCPACGVPMDETAESRMAHQAVEERPLGNYRSDTGGKCGLRADTERDRYRMALQIKSKTSCIAEALERQKVTGFSRERMGPCDCPHCIATNALEREFR